MIKKHLQDLIDFRVILFLIVVIALCAIITLLISDKVKDFGAEYKKKFYGYILSFAIIYALLAFLGNSKKMEGLSVLLIMYQSVSLFLGILHAWIYRSYFKEFKVKSFSVEVLFALIVPLYSSILFLIIYAILNGIDFTFLMSGHFVMFLVPTAIYITFCFMLLIPPKIIATWTPEKFYKTIEEKEMHDILLITLWVKKEQGDNEYASIRAKTPAKVDFGRLFFLATEGYNKQNINNPIQMLMPDRKNCNWIFYLKPKWYKTIRYVDALRDAESNGIAENSVVICERTEKKNAAPEEKKKPDAKVYGKDSKPNDPNQNKIDELKEPEDEEGPIN